MMNTKTVWPGAPIFGRWHEEQAVVIASGQDTLKRGQVMSRGDDDKWYRYVKESSVVGSDADGSRGTALDAVTIASATKDYEFFLKHQRIVPGTLTLKSDADSDDSSQYSDDGLGYLSGVAGVQWGFVDYPSGYVRIHWESGHEAGDILASYRYRNAAGKSVPRGVLVDWEVDATSETTGTVVIIGEVIKDRLEWPTNTTAAEIARAIALLENEKIYAITQQSS